MSECGNCSLCLAAVGVLELLPRPVLRIMEDSLEVAAGVCAQVPGPSGKECYAITSVIAHAFDLVLKGENATLTCQVLGACNATAATHV